jgi:hypothetical protein
VAERGERLRLTGRMAFRAFWKGVAYDAKAAERSWQHLQMF